MTTRPAERKRCPLCRATLEVCQVGDDGSIVNLVLRDAHSAESCARDTAQRIKVLEETHFRDEQELRQQQAMIDEISSWVGLAGGILDAGGKWLAHRAQRAGDISRLRSAFGTQDRTLQHPLWQAEEAVAVAIRAAMDVVEKRSKS